MRQLSIGATIGNDRRLVFDAYGTLLDIHSAVRRHAGVIGPDFQAFSDLWRAKQLEYSWVRTLMGEYADFWRLTEEALFSLRGGATTHLLASV